MELDRLMGQDAVQVDGGDQGSHLREHQPHQHGHYVWHKTLSYLHAGLLLRICTADNDPLPNFLSLTSSRS